VSDNAARKRPMRSASGKHRRLLLLLFALLCASVVGDDADCASVCAARVAAVTSELQVAASQQEAAVAFARKACDVRVTEAESTTSKVRAQLEAAESQARELKATSAGTEGDLVALKKKASLQEAQLAAAQKEHSSTLETLASKGAELEKVQRTLKDVQEGRAQDKAAIAALRAELDTAKTAAHQQLAALHSELDDLRRSVLPPVLRPLLAAAANACTQLAARAQHVASGAAAHPHVAAAWRHISEAWARAAQLMHDSGGLEMAASLLDSMRGAAEKVIPQAYALAQRCQHAVHVVLLELKEVMYTRFGSGVASILDSMRGAAQEVIPQALALAQRCQHAVQAVDFSGAWLRFQQLISQLRAFILHAGQSARGWVEAHQPSVDAWRLMSVEALQQFHSLATSTFGQHLQAGADSALLYATHLKQRIQDACKDHLPGAAERASAAAQTLVASMSDLWAMHAGDANPSHAAAAALAVALLGAGAFIARHRRSVKPAAAAAAVQRNGRSAGRPSSSPPPPAASPEPPLGKGARRSRGTRG
jgi:hypothetical protein